ncbi:MAG: acid phosphatase [Opitutus sp.]|nr:acid phosphatase [Opitutus sp.]
MFQRLVVPVLAFGFALAFAGCSTPASNSARGPATAAATATVTVAEPPNLYLLKQELKAYIDRGDYDAGIAQVAGEAKAWIEQRAAQGGKLAIVLDIDETALSNLKHMREMDFGYIPALWDQWVADADGPAIESVRDIFRTARTRGVAVFFMTGRKTTDAPGTIKNLQAAGMDDYAGLDFKPNGYADTTQSFKTATRKKITEDGYTIIANIGDQHSDLDGGYAERTFKLPNPFYITK